MGNEARTTDGTRKKDGDGMPKRYHPMCRGMIGTHDQNALSILAKGWESVGVLEREVRSLTLLTGGTTTATLASTGVVALATLVALAFARALTLATTGIGVDVFDGENVVCNSVPFAGLFVVAFLFLAIVVVESHAVHLVGGTILVVVVGELLPNVRLLDLALLELATDAGSISDDLEIILGTHHLRFRLLLGLLRGCPLLALTLRSILGNIRILVDGGGSLGLLAPVVLAGATTGFTATPLASA